MDGKIKRISIGMEIPKQFHIGVGSIFPVYIDGERINTEVNNIQQTEKHYFVYVKYNAEIHLWKKVPKNEYIFEEYFLD